MYLLFIGAHQAGESPILQLLHLLGAQGGDLFPDMSSVTDVAGMAT